MAIVVPLAQARAMDRFGGKAAQLAALADVKSVRVPTGFAISADAFREALKVLPTAQWPDRLLVGPAVERRGDRVAAIRHRFIEAPIASNTLAEILSAYRAMGGGLVAVRSSALHEDTQGASAAGLQETILSVDGEDALEHAIKTCFSSIYNERAIAYLARLKSRPSIGVAVVVQRMLDPEAAGVMFTLDPVRRETGVMVIEAAHGLGCAVVDGSIAPDVFRIDRTTGALRECVVGEKRYAARVVGQRIQRVALTREEASRPALDDAQLRVLAEAGRAIETAMGDARDIEWAFERGQLWVLQSRPIVGVTHGTDDRRSWVWSNVNVGEALPGVATPLTWSVGSAFSEVGFRRAFGALGCTVPDDAELVGQFHGRIYLNLTLFMGIVSQVPALDPKVLLEFGGGGGLDLLEEQVHKGSWGKFLLRAPLIGTRYLSENIGLNRRLEQFEKHFADQRAKFESSALPSLTSRELAERLKHTEALLDRTGAMMLTCASGSLSSIVALRALLKVFAPTQAARLERELLTGIADVESAAPGIALVHIAGVAKREAAARAIVENTDPSALTLSSLPEGGPTRRALEAFLKAYGYRAAREAELSTPRWREAPQMLFVTIRAEMARDEATALSRVDKQVTVRADAERELDSVLPAAARAAARHLLSRTRKFVRLRERMRARVTEVLGFFRMLALETSVRIAKRDPQAGTDGAFYFHLDELRSFLLSELVDVAPLIAVRRADMARDLARPDPPSTFVGSPPPVAPALLPSNDRLSGIAASSGCVVGTVRLLRESADGMLLVPGEILVAPVADVGWTPLFLSAAAVITELGGALSHAALVAREYGVPAVVNVAGAMRALATGDRVRVDGDNGIIEIISRANSSVEQLDFVRSSSALVPHG